MTESEWIKGEICEASTRILVRVFGIGTFYMGSDKMPKMMTIHKFDAVEVQLDPKHEKVIFIRKPLS